MTLPLRISLTEGGSPAEQIGDQLRGLIAAGLLHGGERLPSVRQLAGDLGIAPGTVAKVYRSLEADGFVVAKVGAGTRVNPDAANTPGAVLKNARTLVETSKQVGMSHDEISRILGAIWAE